MLRDTDVTTLVAVKDLAEATAFYEDKLRLTRLDQSGEWVQYRSGGSDVIIYESDDGGSNQATTAAWTVKDVRETVRELKANGVDTFEHYDDLHGTRREGHIHVAGEVKMARFRDPSGNPFEVNGRS